MIAVGGPLGAHVILWGYHQSVSASVDRGRYQITWPMGIEHMGNSVVGVTPTDWLSAT
jgi:hypothetical protein